MDSIIDTIYKILITKTSINDLKQQLNLDFNQSTKLLYKLTYENLSIIMTNIEKSYNSNPQIQNISMFILNFISHQIAYIKEVQKSNENKDNISFNPYQSEIKLKIEELRLSQKFLTKSCEQFAKIINHLADKSEFNNLIKQMGRQVFQFGKNIKNIFDKQNMVQVGASELDPLSNSLISLRELFTVISHVSENQESKNLCLIQIVNQIFRVQFNLNTIKSDLFSFLDGNTLPNLSLFEEKDLCLQFQFRGSIDIVNKRQQKAFEWMENCIKFAGNYGADKFQKLVAEKQILLQLLNNKFVDQNTLRKLNLEIQSQLISYISSGNIKEQDIWFEKYEEYFLVKKVQMIVISLRLLVFLNLLKLICNQFFHSKQSYQVKVNSITQILGKMKFDVDSDEIQGYLCHFIQSGMIRAQISMDHDTIVFDKKMPFDQEGNQFNMY